MNIGMSISNYGTRMRFDGIDIYQPVDISEFEEGNYGDVAGQFRPSEWELPLIFRIGVALKPLVTTISDLTVSADALHPNNNSESINLGAALDNKIPGVGVFSVRGGVKAIYMDNPEYGYTAGLGLKMFYLGNKFISIDYAYKAIGLLGNVHVYTLGFSFQFDMPRYLTYVFCIGLIALSCFNRNDFPQNNNVLAKVGNRIITVQDFIRRAEYTIRPDYCKQ